MAIALIAPNRDLSGWIAAFRHHMSPPQEALYVWPDIPNSAEVRCAVVWNHPRGCLKTFPNLRIICSLGAGVDHILMDPDLPVGIPITRVTDDKLAFSMSNYVVTAVLFHHRMLGKFMADKQQERWAPVLPSENSCRVGIFGFGRLGQESGKKLRALGFEVLGYSKTKKKLDGFECFAGPEELDVFLGKINVLVCLLPATPETKGILNKSLFDRMTRGTYLVNAARGHHQVTTDIMEAIDHGQLSGAFLDVFENEPLPAGHPVWKHPQIMITPHVASITNPESVVPQMISDYQLVLKGGIPNLTVDRNKGY